MIRNSPNNVMDSSLNAKVAYQFTCPEVECNVNQQSYIGYTTNTVKERVQQHFSKGAIHDHGFEVHNKRFSKDMILKSTKVIHKDRNVNNLRILEAIYIKEQRPSINLKDEGFTRTLSIF